MQVNFVYYKNKLEEAGVIFDVGMNESEIVAAENFYKFKFPPDLKDFLMFALPVSKGWTNWRKLGSPEIDDAFSWIYEGIYFDIENNAFWLDDWGEMRWAEGLPTPVDNFRVWLTFGEKSGEIICFDNGFLNLFAELFCSEV